MPLPRIYFEKLLENSPDIVVAVDHHGSIGLENLGLEIGVADLAHHALTIAMATDA